ncbi:MAG: DinB family protein [Steroidobacteraceae bacterium]|nr:DinB family protein [Steroidobacteraceae bacterium]
MTQAPYSRLIAVKRWADRGLYDALSRNLDRLSREDVTLMLRVLDHMHAVDRIFQHHLQGLPHTFRAPRSETIPELGALASSAKEVDDWYAAYVDSLSEDDFEQPVDFVFTSGKRARMSRGEIILHVCLHGTYHRGNAGALLQLRGITPHRDSITDFLEDAEANASTDARPA